MLSELSPIVAVSQNQVIVGRPAQNAARTTKPALARHFGVYRDLALLPERLIVGRAGRLHGGHPALNAARRMKTPAFS